MSAIKVIFLDFDGVLNGGEYLADISDWLSFDALDKDKIQLVNRIIKETGAKVVISSSWRIGYPLEEIEEELIKRGFKGEIIGATPSLATRRGIEIQTWMDEYPGEIRSFVILDDESDMEHLHQFLIQTDPSIGIVEEDVDIAVYLLNRLNFSGEDK